MSNPASPLKVGIVGTGYAARKRAEAIKSDSRAELLVATGNNPARLQEFCVAQGIDAVDSWSSLVNLPHLDLIFICSINQGCGAIARAAILADKHVVIEYPLALSATVAAEVIELAASNNKLLHVEHIEIIGGLHQAVKQLLPELGHIFHATYSTIAAQHPVVPSWKYHRAQFGFPLAAALSRVHRLTDLFGKVTSVICDNRYWDGINPDYFNACLCNAQLKFNSGVTAQISYGKGDIFWESHRIFEVYGEQGKISFQGQQGTVILKDTEEAIPITPRRGLFAQDTKMVLDYLFEQQPLYIQPQASLHALRVAIAAEESARTGKIIELE
ncbi:MAG: Gfo/Idh/MocA family oxidoreductase [Cyanobacteria bacterium J06621_8]